MIIQGSFPGGRPINSVVLLRKKLHSNVNVQRLSFGNAFMVDDKRMNLRDNGAPLPNDILQKMESIFKTDFSNIRIHTNSRQAESIGALSFATGNDIYFAQGLYNPNSPYGQRLLGHELTHVVQQKNGRVKNPFGAGIAVVQDPGLEAEAERMALQITSHSKTTTSVKPLQMKKSSPGKGVIQPFGPASVGFMIAMLAHHVVFDMEVFKTNGFWELCRNGKYLWHAGSPDTFKFLYMDEKYRRWRDLYSYPVFARIGYWQGKYDGTYEWKEGFANTNTLNDSKKEYKPKNDMLPYPLYFIPGYWVVNHKNEYEWKAGEPDTNVLLNTNQEHSINNGIPYPLYNLIGYWIGNYKEEYEWKAGKPDTNLLANTNQQYKINNGIDYPLYIPIGYLIGSYDGTYEWKAGKPINNLENTNKEYKAGFDKISYKVFIQFPKFCEGWLESNDFKTALNKNPGLISDASKSKATRFRWFDAFEIKLKEWPYAKTFHIGANLHYNINGEEPLGALWITKDSKTIGEFHPFDTPIIPNGIRVFLLGRLRTLSKQFHTGQIEGMHINEDKPAKKKSTYGANKWG